MSYYTPTGNPMVLSRGLSPLIDNEFNLIAAAINNFAADVTTYEGTTAGQLALLATLASPAFTGVPTAPTASVGTSSGQIATTAFVTAVAMSAVLPAQASNAGKYITTDGTNASWASLPAATVPVGSALYLFQNCGGF